MYNAYKTRLHQEKVRQANEQLAEKINNKDQEVQMKEAHKAMLLEERKMKQKLDMAQKQAEKDRIVSEALNRAAMNDLMKRQKTNSQLEMKSRKVQGFEMV